MSTRSQNENKFESWEETSHGGRMYRREVPGRRGWKAVYWKEVDENENTLRFLQEIHDETGRIVEIHEKFPVDKGHRKL